jgi:hypothetical protein
MSRPSTAEIDATDCVFVPAATGGVLILSGKESPAPLLRTLVWTGQGSVLPLRSPLALWRLSDGRMQAASEESLQVEGLVRTGVGFRR